MFLIGLPLELVLLFAAWKKQWKWSALGVVLGALAICFVFKVADGAAQGGLSSILTGYYFLIHAATIASLTCMTLNLPKGLKMYRK